MKVIEPGKTFCANSAIVLEREELEFILHNLRAEESKINGSGGKYYSKWPIRRLQEFIKQLEEYQKSRGWH